MTVHWNADGITIASKNDVIVMIYAAVPKESHFATLQHVELETLIRQPDDYDPSDLLGILKYARSRRAEFPLDEPGEIAVTAKRESILAA